MVLHDMHGAGCMVLHYMWCRVFGFALFVLTVYGFALYLVQVYGFALFVVQGVWFCNIYGAG